MSTSAKSLHFLAAPCCLRLPPSPPTTALTLTGGRWVVHAGEVPLPRPQRLPRGPLFGDKDVRLQRTHAGGFWPSLLSAGRVCEKRPHCPPPRRSAKMNHHPIQPGVAVEPYLLLLSSTAICKYKNTWNGVED